MSLVLQRTSNEDYARFDRFLGNQVVRQDSSWWRKVRTFFYRPLVITQAFRSNEVCAPSLSILGGYQHVVPQGERSNSTVNLLLAQDPATYAPETLDANRRRQLKKAAVHFGIEPVEDPHVFARDAHAAYCSFYSRTKYEYGSRRLDPHYFAEWTASLFAQKNVLILGAFQQRMLQAVSLSLWVGDTLFYATFFSNEPALRLGVSDLMLHSVRELARTQPAIRQFCAGNYKGGVGLDQFYLLRGFRVGRLPARLRLNPVVGFLLQQFAAPRMRLLRGDESPANSATPA